MSSPIELSTGGLLIGMLAIFAGSLLQASTGLGLGMVAAPVLLLIDPDLVPGPLLMLALVISVMVATREWRSIDRKGLSFALSGRVAGTLLAGLTISLIPLSIYSLLFGLLVLCAVVLSATGWRVMPTPRNLLAAGVASGYMGTLTSIGAPPLALAYQHGTASAIRATMAAYFVIGSALSILMLAAVGKFAGEQLLASITFIPALVAGFWLSGRLVKRMNGRMTRYAVLGLSGLSAVILVVKSLPISS